MLYILAFLDKHISKLTQNFNGMNLEQLTIFSGPILTVLFHYIIFSQTCYLSFLQVDVKPAGCNFWDFSIFSLLKMQRLPISRLVHTFPYTP